MWTLPTWRGTRRLFGRPRRASAGRRGTRLTLEDLESRLVLSTDPYVYIASFGTNTIERFEALSAAPAPAKHQTGATFVAANSGGVNHPLGTILGPQDHNLYVTSLETDQVLRYSGKNGKLLGVFIDSSLGVLHNPSGILFGPDGNIYVANAQPAASNVVRFDPDGNFIDVYAQLPTSGGATGMVFGPDGKLYISTRFSNGVVRTDGTTIEDFIAPGDGGLSRTAGMVFGPDGNFYVGSENTNDILKFNGVTGQFMGEFVAAGSGGLRRPAGILFGPYGDLYVADADSNAILHYNGRTGAYINTLISQDEDPNLSGPRQLFFGNTNPTTLNYVPRRRDDAPGDGSASASADVGTSLVTGNSSGTGVQITVFTQGVTGSSVALPPLQIPAVDSSPASAAVSSPAFHPLHQVNSPWTLDDGALNLLALNLLG